MSRVLHGTTLRVVVIAAASAAVLGTSATAAVAGGPGTQQRYLPSAVPSAVTPNITDGTVYSINTVGNLVLAGGSFTGVQDAGSTTTLRRTDLLGFDATTGKVSTAFAPSLDGIVKAIAPGPTSTTAYIGGYFDTVNGVRSKSIALVDTTTGALVPTFHPPALNGAVFDLASARGHLIIGGSFTLAGASSRGGLASLNPTTGALDTYLSVNLLGHHNYDGTSATVAGAVGARALSINPAQNRMVVVGNFTTAAGLARDQIALIDLGPARSAVDRNWATLKYTAACHIKQVDSYVTDVEYSPDGSYFAVTATGGNGVNRDGSRALCDGAARWDSAATGADVAPRWVDLTGGDTFYSVAVTGAAVYAGGHQRWVNNPSASGSAQPGAVPRPGLAALDPLSGLPLSWNPGRNPRGAGAYAIFATAKGVYVGSDTDYFGNFHYKRQKIGFFPLYGGTRPASTTVATLPGDVYLTGPTNSAPATTSSLVSRSFDGHTAGPQTISPPNGVDWSIVHGAFIVGSTLFFGTTGGKLYRASFAGGSLSRPTAVDPYHDPAWSGVATGSGQTYNGALPNYYAELKSVTGAFYSNGRLYYTRANKPDLYWRWFSPDSGVVGAQEFTVTGVDFHLSDGMFLSGSTLYFANERDGDLRSVSFAGGNPQSATTVVVSGPTVDGRDWRSNGLFLPAG